MIRVRFLSLLGLRHTPSNLCWCFPRTERDVWTGFRTYVHSRVQA